MRVSEQQRADILRYHFVERVKWGQVCFVILLYNV